MITDHMPMTRAFLFVSLLAGVASSAAMARGAEAPPVVVEFFTSQGCSSCPPADNFLGELAQRADVLALAFHVDYWNYIGWTDPFASKLATQRPPAYSPRLAPRHVYHPPTGVHGGRGGVGRGPRSNHP